ncbi:MAG: hypothetical protein JWM10_2764 [Myxococcaceae bacterium]|nr:hypothetical protein [Myxococcaceae bacterium]
MATMNTATTVDDIPAPPAPGQADALDEVLVGLPTPPRARRRVLAVLLTVIPVAALFLASQMIDDVRYAMAPTSAVSLGDGRTADPASVGANHYVTLRASPSMAGAVTYSRLLWPGEHLVFPVAGRDGAPIYVQVSQDGAQAMARGEFRGRLMRFAGGGGRYAGVGQYLHDTLRAPVRPGTWLLVDGATPRGNAWAPLLVTLLLAIALSDLDLLRRLFRRTPG